MYIRLWGFSNAEGLGVCHVAITHGGSWLHVCVCTTQLLVGLSNMGREFVDRSKLLHNFTTYLGGYNP